MIPTKTAEICSKLDKQIRKKMQQDNKRVIYKEGNKKSEESAKK